MKVAVALVCLLIVCVAEAKLSKTFRKNRLEQQLKDKPDDVKAVVLAAENMRDYFASSFCTDSVSFPGNAKKGFTPVKPGVIKPKNNQAESSVPIILAGGNYNAIVNAGKNIYENKIGCCSTFAVAMFAQLAPTIDTKGPRIELICVGSGFSGTHCFLVVGRNAGAPGVRPNLLGKGGSFPDAANWGADAVVIDPWLMSLGHTGINLNPVAGPRSAACNSNECTDMCLNPVALLVANQVEDPETRKKVKATAVAAQKSAQVCYPHGESLGFDGGKLFIEKPKVA